ncbi:hypothetical protein AB0M92_18945 [Streptomyces sp. NPDC051582]|uniref:hypothetical protein n=1 Tax=Streptomyces sp. NPDC051582 TaxID=3155167 RepID=UPI003447B7DA
MPAAAAQADKLRPNQPIDASAPIICCRCQMRHRRIGPGAADWECDTCELSIAARGGRIRLIHP